MAKRAYVSKKEQATALRWLIIAVITFVLMIVVVPQLTVSADAIAAENNWYKFHQFFVDLNDHFSANAMTYLFFVVVILGSVYLYRKFLNKR